MRSSLALVALMLAAGCATSRPLPRLAVVDRALIAPPTEGNDSGIAIVYDARVCSVTIDAAGKRIEWTAPDVSWQLQDSRSGAVLVGIAPLPPGGYALVGFTIASTWRQGVSTMGRALGRTNCTRQLERHALHFPVEVRTHEISLAPLHRPTIDFDTLGMLRVAASDPIARVGLASWLPKLEAARDAARASLIAARREPRDGYDVYRACDGATAIVRTTGTPFSWIAHPDDAAVREQFRARALAALRGIRSQTMNGFGAACVRPPAFMLGISDPREIDDAVRQIGEWLVREDLQGEVSLVLVGKPELL